MDRTGEWFLSPAYDVTYAHNPAGRWTNQHQMTIGGKRDHFTEIDLATLGTSIGIRHPRTVIDEIIDVVSRWPDFAQRADLPIERTRQIGAAHRLVLAKG